MGTRNPEDLDRLFAGALNTGNVDALMDLYEIGPRARPSTTAVPLEGRR